MCRSTDIHGFNFTVVDRNRLKINGFYVRLHSVVLKSCIARGLPDSLTLVYLPRIGASPLEISGSKIRPDSPAFVTLHRIVMNEKKARTRTTGGGGGVVVEFASRERVRASEGVRFEVYCGEEKVVKGIFRKDQDEEDEEWKMECKCGLKSEMVGVDQVTNAEVSVAAEGRVAMSEKVEMVVVKRKKKNNGFFRGLEVIPEEREVEDDDDDDNETTNGCDCGCYMVDGGDCDVKDGDEEVEMEMEMEMEGARWAVEVGILVMSLGLGFLVSKASSKSVRLGRIL